VENSSKIFHNDTHVVLKCDTQSVLTKRVAGFPQKARGLYTDFSPGKTHFSKKKILDL
jgi:hypothetical protein